MSTGGEGDRPISRAHPSAHVTGDRGGPPAPARPPGASRYGWFVGVVALLAIAYITLNTATTPPNGSHGPTVGLALPAFAVPIALSDLEGDANIATRPSEGLAGRKPACVVRGPKILNICQLAHSRPLALGLFVPAGDCARVLDELSALRASFPGLQIAGVAVRGNRAKVRALIRRRGWGFPVGYDRDGALANLYRMALCSEITLVLPDGRVQAALIGAPDPAVLRQRLMALVARSRALGWRPGR